jgi:hypothetical protein
VDGSAVLCSAAGWACFESTFPVLHSGILWADCCADSGYCEVSLHLIFFTCICCFCGSGFFVFLLLLAAVVCLMVWFYGSALVGRLYYDGQRGFDACWVIACSW